jgi:gluconolactonase
MTTASSEVESGPLVGLGELELVESSVPFLELEGPQWMPDEGVLLFSDVSANTIYQVGTDDEITEFRKPSNYANGLAVDPQGRLIAAEAGKRRVTRTESDGSVVSIADHFEGARLNQPNDVTVRSDGTIYFTDPAFGDADANAELDFRGVFRIAPDGRLTAEYRGETSEAPNGVALSPDESLLYVTDFFAGVVRVFEVAKDGSLSKARTFVEVAGPDGMAVDEAGNLFIASYDGGAIEVFAPDSEHWGTIDLPASASNCAFGDADGRTLYITTTGPLPSDPVASRALLGPSQLVLWVTP